MRDSSIVALRKVFSYSNELKGKTINSEKCKEIVLGPAYKDFTPRTIKGLKKEDIKEALTSLAELVCDYITADKACDSQSSFDKWHEETCNTFLSQCKNQSGKTIPYGKAQKILNMTMKYLYCFSDTEKYATRFKFCHMPLDSYTLEWFCDMVVPVFNKEQTKKSVSISTIKETSWSKLSLGKNKEEVYSYLWIQEQIRNYLQSRENRLYRNGNKDPLTPFEAEFYIWPEQQLKQALKSIKGLKETFDCYPECRDNAIQLLCQNAIDGIASIQSKFHTQ